jgi:hypothetical protein
VGVGIGTAVGDGIGVGVLRRIGYGTIVDVAFGVWKGSRLDVGGTASGVEFSRNAAVGVA